MRTLIGLLFITLVSLGCKQSTSTEKEKTESSGTEKLDRISERIEENLSDEKEKVILLSQISNIPFDTLNLLLRDYYIATDTLSSFDKNVKDIIQNTIATISKTYKISKSKVASMVFSYKYEMLTKGEIEERAIENIADEYHEEESEPYDPY